MHRRPRPRHRAGRGRGRVGEDRCRRRRVTRDEGPRRRGGRERRVRGVAPGRMDDHPGQAAVQDVLVVDGRGGQQGQHRVDAAGVDEDRVRQLRQDGDVGLAGRTEVADQGRPLTLVDGDQAGVGALDRLLEDHVGLVEPGRGAVTRVVADLDGEGGPGRHHPAGGRGPGQRTGGRHGRGCRGRRGGRAADFLGGEPLAQDRVGQAAHGQDHHRGPDAVPELPGGSRPLGPQLLAGATGMAGSFRWVPMGSFRRPASGGRYCRRSGAVGGVVDPTSNMRSGLQWPCRTAVNRRTAVGVTPSPGSAGQAPGPPGDERHNPSVRSAGSSERQHRGEADKTWNVTRHSTWPWGRSRSSSARARSCGWGRTST